METLNTKEVLWANIVLLMDRAYGREHLSKFAGETGIGNATMTRIKERDSFVRTETLERIAEKFRLQPWQLLVPGLGADRSGLDQTESLPQIERGPAVEPDKEAVMLEKEMVWSLFSRLDPAHRARLVAEMYSLGQADAPAEERRKNLGAG